jgi:DedD protein
VERQVKERLIGAAVLVAAAVILIPEMLSGPRQKGSDQPAPVDGQAPLKTYTIDLSKSPSAQAAITAPVVDERAPPPESSAQSPVTTESPPAAAPATAQPEATDVEPPSANAAEPPHAAPEPRSEPAPAGASASSHAGSGWAVQLGSFSNQATAERMVQDLRTRGHEAFVMPVKSGGNTLYRVRIGPLASREEAAAALQRVKTLAPNAAVVAHP